MYNIEWTGSIVEDRGGLTRTRTHSPGVSVQSFFHFNFYRYPLKNSEYFSHIFKSMLLQFIFSICKHIIILFPGSHSARIYIYNISMQLMKLGKGSGNRSQTITKKYVGQQIYNHQGQQAQSDVVPLSMS